MVTVLVQLALVAETSVAVYVSNEILWRFL